MSKKRRCRCCGKEIRIMCMSDYCSGRCEDGKCGHRGRAAED